MQAFTRHTGLVVSIDRRDIDTDAIIPKQFMKSIHRTGFGPHLFDALRYLDHGEPGQDIARRTPNPEFALNQARYQGASVLLCRANFGCGSSREHAPWAIAQFGIRVLIAPSFADIFFDNCFKNGLLPIVLSDREIDQLFEQTAAEPGYALSVDLERQTVCRPDGVCLPFDVQPFRKHCLLNGYDDIDLTLKHQEQIAAFELKRLTLMPWLRKRL